MSTKELRKLALKFWVPRLFAAMLLALLSLLAAGTGLRAEPAASENLWYSVNADGEPRVTLYFFWTTFCPHCARARPAIAEIAGTRPWLDLRSYNVEASEADLEFFRDLAGRIGQEVEGVPAFLLCGRMVTGFGEPAESTPRLARIIDRCHAAILKELAAATNAQATPDSLSLAENEPPAPVALPFIGDLDAAALSLPLLTVVLGGLDAFNPCAFFVLLFLLSLLANAQGRGRMLLIGGTFLIFSGAIYFAFMAAWLNLFLVLQSQQVVTIAAGLVAVALALLNIKDFFWFGQGPSLGIPEKARPRLVARMHGLLSARSLPALLAGTAVLAIAANSYELLCTSGLPMVYTRALTLNDLPTAGFYLYLALYNVIYVLPLLAITLAFTLTLGGRRLSEPAARALKLLSGLLMLGLGLVLLLAPSLLDNLVTTAALFGAALAITGLAVVYRRHVSASSDHGRTGEP